MGVPTHGCRPGLPSMPRPLDAGVGAHDALAPHKAPGGASAVETDSFQTKGYCGFLAHGRPEQPDGPPALSKTAVPVGVAWQATPVGPAVDGLGRLDIKSVTAEQMDALSPSQLKRLMAQLAQSRMLVLSPRVLEDGSPVQVRSFRMTRPGRLNAGSAMLLVVASFGDRELLARTAAVTPAPALGVLRESPLLQDLMTPRAVHMMIDQMRRSAFARSGPDAGDAPRFDAVEMDTLGTLFHFAVSQQAQVGGLDRYGWLEVARELVAAGEGDLPEEQGLTLGALVSGLKKMHAEMVRKNQQAKGVASILANQVWLLSLFMQPLMAFVLPYLAVTGSQAMDKWVQPPSTYEDLARGLLVDVQQQWLNQTGPSEEERWATQRAIDYCNLCVQANGF